MLGFLLQLHGWLSTIVATYALLTGAFAALLFFTRRPPNSNLWGALAIGEGLMVAQFLVGVGLWLAGGRASGRPELHVLYGLSTIVAIPLTYYLLRNRSTPFASALFSVALFFLWGLTQRAVETALH